MLLEFIKQIGTVAPTSRTISIPKCHSKWFCLNRLDDVTWIRGHKIVDDIVFPAAGFISMVGEAIRQITALEDFSVRRIAIQTALLLQSSEPIGTTTSLRPVRLNSDLDPHWYDFSIASYNGSSWTQHCRGQVRVGGKPAVTSSRVEVYDREISTRGWYSAIRRVGLNYGPTFQRLTDLTASPSFKIAAAALSRDGALSRSTYQLHPTIIDSCLQLFTSGAPASSCSVSSMVAIIESISKIRKPFRIGVLPPVCDASTCAAKMSKYTSGPIWQVLRVPIDRLEY